MAVEQKQSEKGAFVEKLLFAILPLIIAGVGYLLSEVSKLGTQVTILESKVSLVVTQDNKQASNTGSELAREKLRQDLTENIQRNRDTIMDNQQKIAILEEKMKRIEKR